jgi:hypothetical protein
VIEEGVRNAETPRWELRTEHATITTTWGVWKPGPRLQALLDEGWEPFQVFPVPNHGGLSCPLVWLRRLAHLEANNG